MAVIPGDPVSSYLQIGDVVSVATAASMTTGTLHVTGNSILDGNLTVTGDTDLDVSVNIRDPIVDVNTVGTAAASSGLKIITPTGAAPNKTFLYIAADDSFKAGTEGAEKRVAILSDTLTDGNILTWDNTTKNLETPALAKTVGIVSNTVAVDTITEKTLDNGVNIETVNIKDGNIIVPTTKSLTADIISSTTTNGNLTLTGNGTGKVVVGGLLSSNSITSTGDIVITPNDTGVGSLVVKTNMSTTMNEGFKVIDTTFTTYGGRLINATLGGSPAIISPQLDMAGYDTSATIESRCRIIGSTNSQTAETGTGVMEFVSGLRAGHGAAMSNLTSRNPYHFQHNLTPVLTCSYDNKWIVPGDFTSTAGTINAASLIADSLTSKATNGNLTLTGNGTGNVVVSDTLKLDIISENTLDNGVDIETVHIEDGDIIVPTTKTLTADYISSTTTNSNLTLTGNGTGSVTVTDNFTSPDIKCDTLSTLTLNTDILLSGNGTGSVAVVDLLKVDTIGERTASASTTFNQGLKTDVISERTASASTTFNQGLKTDIISEKTADAGVTVDGVLLKDGGVTITGNQTATNFLSTTAGGAVRLTEAFSPAITTSAGQGLIFVKNTVPSSLSFVDDAGTEVNIGRDTARLYAYIEDSSANTILYTGQWAASIVDMNVIGATTHFTKIVGSTYAITSVAASGGDHLVFTTSAAHNFNVGDVVCITDTAQYDAPRMVTAIAGSTFTTTGAFIATQTGTATRPTQFNVGTGSFTVNYYIVRLIIHVMSSAGNIVMAIKVYNDNIPMPGSKIGDTIPATTGTTLHTIGIGQLNVNSRIWIGFNRSSGTGQVIIEDMSITCDDWE